MIKHLSFVVSASFTNQELAQIELWTKGEQYGNEVYVLPKHLDEKVARLHLAKIGAELRKEQAGHPTSARSSSPPAGKATAPSCQTCWTRSQTTKTSAL